MSEEYTLEVYGNINDAAHDWLEFEQHAIMYPFQAFEWVRMWYDTIGGLGDSEILVMFVKNSKGIPLLVFPFCIKNNFGLRFLIWLGGFLNDYNAPLLSENYLSTLDIKLSWKTIMQRLPKIDVIHFDKIPNEIHTYNNIYISFIYDRIF